MPPFTMQLKITQILCWSVPSTTVLVNAFPSLFQNEFFLPMDEVDLIGATALRYFRELTSLSPS